MSGITIGNVSLAERVFFVAEIGSNHTGSLDIACSLIREAARRGADAVKFQSFRAASLQRARTKGGSGPWQVDPVYRNLKKCQLPVNWHSKLQRVAADCGVMFLSTAFDLEQVDFLQQLGVPAFKIASGDITFHALLRRAARYHRPILLSTGASTLEEVGAAVSAIREEGNEQIVLMHCVSLYPPAPKDLNLKAIQTLSSVFKTAVGFSDHSLELANVVAAVALGARVVERHFTFSRGLPGPDHPFATEPGEFELMVKTIRRLEQALGSGEKVPAGFETQVRKTGRRGLYAARKIDAGETIAPEMLKALRPVVGAVAVEGIDRVVGSRAVVDIEKDEPITEEVLESEHSPVPRGGGC